LTSRAAAARIIGDVNPLYAALEVGVFALFAAAAMAALRRGRLPFLELLSAAAFGLLLEEGDQLMFGTYHYSSDWTLAIYRAPIAIGLTWALIIAGVMRISDALGVRRRYAPFSDAVLALSLDLAFDAIAIRIGLWTWVGVDLQDGWFGVPAVNFYVWLWVAFTFSLLTRWLRGAAEHRSSLDWLQLALPVPAYGLLLAAIVPFAVLKPMLDPSPGGGLLLFAITVLGFVAVAGWGVWGQGRSRPDGQRLGMLDLRLAFAVRLAIHLSFLVALFASGLAAREPVLLAVAVTLGAAEIPLALLVAQRLGGRRAGIDHVGGRRGRSASAGPLTEPP
jgi:hypothetical protein